ncbi:MAG: glycosyltransferase family 4 protein [Candidatus Falkowbacteria bacterium]
MNDKISNGAPKILYFITQSEFGGAQRYVFDLANNLKGDFQVAVALGEQGNNGKLAKILQENNIEHFVIPHLKRNLSPINDLLAFFQIIKLIKNYQPDIIHLNSSKISVLGSMACLFTKPKTVYTVHGWVFNEPLPAWLKYFYLYAEKFTAGFKNKIICVSEFDRQMALKYKIALENKLVTIHNGIAPINFYSKEEAKKVISRVMSCELRAAGLLIGSIGNLYKTKGFKYLIEAANILINKDKMPATFLIIGDGSERKNLKNLIKKYNLKNNFILAGQIDEAAKLLKVFDIYACSSVKEGLSYTLIEAMQAGLPIAATEVGGNPEIIENSKTGLLVKPAEAQNLANALEKLINDKNLAASLGEKAKQNVSQKFGLEKMVEKTRKVYLSLRA